MKPHLKLSTNGTVVTLSQNPLGKSISELRRDEQIFLRLSIAARLKDAREQLELSPANFAVACGVDRMTQSRYERGVRSPDAVYLYRMSTAFGIDPRRIVLGMDQHDATGADNSEVATPAVPSANTAHDFKAFLASLEETETTISDWAREHGFSPSAVYQVLQGRMLGRRGTARNVLRAMGIPLPSQRTSEERRNQDAETA